MNETLKLVSPFPVDKIVQGFGANAVTAYAGMGLKGHPGIDYGVDWGTPIPAAANSFCYSVMSRNNPNLMAYRAVFTLIEVGDIVYEVSYGHCSDILVQPSTSVAAQDIIANVGNTGDVYVNGQEVTKNSKDSGSHAGSHLHFQVRVLKKVPLSEPDDVYAHYVNDGYGRLELNGFKYIVPDWNNGYNGCVDPAQFFVQNPALLEQIKEEVQVLNQQTDPVVQKSFIDLIIKQCKEWLGWK